MSIDLRRIFIPVICLGVLGCAGLSIYRGVEAKSAAITPACDGDSVGAIRIDDNGRPQMCVGLE